MNEYHEIAHGIGDSGERTWTLSASGFPRDRRSWWRKILGLCTPGRRHDWHPEGFADWRCAHCGAAR